jgi:hypothetical protein
MQYRIGIHLVQYHDLMLSATVESGVSLHGVWYWLANQLLAGHAFAAILWTRKPD